MDAVLVQEFLVILEKQAEMDKTKPDFESKMFRKGLR